MVRDGIHWCSPDHGVERKTNERQQLRKREEEVDWLSNPYQNKEQRILIISKRHILRAFVPQAASWHILRAFVPQAGPCNKYNTSNGSICIRASIIAGCKPTKC